MYFLVKDQGSTYLEITRAARIGGIYDREFYVMLVNSHISDIHLRIAVLQAQARLHRTEVVGIHDYKREES
jgi:hypothetical protein